MRVRRSIVSGRVLPLQWVRWSKPRRRRAEEERIQERIRQEAERFMTARREIFESEWYKQLVEELRGVKLVGKRVYSDSEMGPIWVHAGHVDAVLIADKWCDVRRGSFDVRPLEIVTHDAAFDPPMRRDVYAETRRSQLPLAAEWVSAEDEHEWIVAPLHAVQAYRMRT